MLHGYVFKSNDFNSLLGERHTELRTERGYGLPGYVAKAGHSHPDVLLHAGEIQTGAFPRDACRSFSLQRRGQRRQSQQEHLAELRRCLLWEELLRNGYCQRGKDRRGV